MSLLYDASLIITPTACKESKLYALKPQSGNGDLTWTRNSGATRVNSAGLIENVPYNLVSWSEQFNDASWVKQGSTIVSNSINSPSGILNADTITANGINSVHFIVQNQPSGITRTLSIYAKKETNNFIQLFTGSDLETWANFDLLNGTVGSVGATSTANISSVGNGWYRCILYSASITAGNIAINLITSATSVRSESNTLSTSVYIWGAQLTEGSTPKDYFPTTNRLNVPRIDYSNGSCPSILLEPQRTNLLTYSAQFDNFSWIKAAITVTANAILSPNGTVTADKIIEQAISTQHRFSGSTVAINIGTVYTSSVYVKIGERRYFGLKSGQSGQSQPVFDLLTGTVVEGVGSIENAGNGWYRCSHVFTSINGVFIPYWTILQNPTFIREVYLGDDTSGIYLWGAQLEQGAYPTSYIPTVASTVTRVADTASKTGISSLINSEEGTLFIDQKYLSNLGVKRFGLFGTSIDDRIVFSTSDNTSNVAVFIFINGVNKYAYTYISSDILAWHKFALKWKNGEVKLFVDGLLLNTSLTFTTFPANTLNNISLNAGGINNFEGNIKSIQVYKTALTDTQLQTLTTL